MTQQLITIDRAVLEQVVAALEDIQERFGPMHGEFIFSKRIALDKAYEALTACRAAIANAERVVPTSSLPERDTSKRTEAQGLFRKFDVCRVDGSDQPGGKHYGCEYFVLDVDHDPHAKQALQAYATACIDTHPQLSADLTARHGAAPAQQQADLSHLASIAGFEASIGHLSALVNEQLILLSDVNDICGVDGHDGELEDGESEIIDRVRQHLKAMAPPERTAPQPAQEHDQRKLNGLILSVWACTKPHDDVSNEQLRNLLEQCLPHLRAISALKSAQPVASNKQQSNSVVAQNQAEVIDKTQPGQPPTEREALLLKEMRYIAGISTGQVHRIAMMTLEMVKPHRGITEKAGGA